MKVVFAEKPSVARDYARILGAKTKRDGYIEGNGVAVTWGYGHLVTLADAAKYDEKFKRWSFEHLPIIPPEFELSIIETGAKQYKIIKGLFDKATLIVNGGDAGREGELIFRYIYQKAECKAPVKRLWVSSLTDEAIKEGFSKIEDGTKYDPLFYAGMCRGEADWLFGINGTRALTLSSRSKKPLSVGRVQTPVLCMIAKRFIENQNFVSQPYFVPTLILEKDDKKFKANFKGRFDTEEEAKALLETIKQTIACTKAVKKQKKENQPLLFDLTTLQADSHKKFKFTAQETLDIMQNLYEKHKVVTYPRTDSRYISKDVFKTIPNLFGQVKAFSRYAPVIDKIDLAKLPNKCVNDKKVSDHHAILPTGKKPQGLDDREAKVFSLIVKQFIAAFGPLCIKNTTSLEFTEDKAVFNTTGAIIVEPGWREVFSFDMEEKKKNDDDDDDEEPEEDGDQELPNVDEGDILPVRKKILETKKTKAPALFNEASLLKGMESAGKELDDDEARQAMKDSGLGTPATRAGIIETLIKRTYIERQKNKFFVTDLGISVYESVKEFDFSSPELTGEWEKKLNLMAQGEYERELFMSEVQEFTQRVVTDIKSIGSSIDTGELKCPNCGGLVKKSEKALFCENFPREEEACSFAFAFTIAGKKISEKQATEIVKDGKSAKIIKGFKKKDGSGTFDAFLEVKPDFRIGFAFENTFAPRPAAPQGIETCPRCKKGQIFLGNETYYCSTDDKDCQFGFKIELAGVKISETEVVNIIKNGKSSLIKGFVSPKSGKEFSAFLVLTPEGKLKFELE